MTGAIFLFCLSQIPFGTFSQAVQVEGNAFLEDQTYHNGIMIAFERFAPQYLYDTAYSDSAGYYSIQLEQGMYNISYSKQGFLDLELEGVPVYSDLTLPDTILEQVVLSGSLSGVLESGTYTITWSIRIDPGDTLLIEPGTTLLFKDSTNFFIHGMLIAEGTVNDSILFTRFNEQNTWLGIVFGSTSNDNSVISYAAIEYCNAHGLSINDCSPQIHHSAIRYNQNHQWQMQGGGVYIYNSDAMLYDLSIYKNNAVSGGGIYLKVVTEYPGESYKTIVSNCQIFENTADNGSGIYFEIWNYSGVTKYPLLINSTVARNYTGSAVSTTESCLPNMINNIIAYNEGYGVESPLGCIRYFGYNDVSHNTAGNFYNPPEWIGENITVNENGDSCDAYHNILVDPLFKNLQENDFHLGLNSPCIDAGLNDSVVNSTDYDGNPRILFCANSLTVDMGAYETLPVGIAHIRQDENEGLIIAPNPASEWIQIIIPGICLNERCILFIFNSSGVMIEQLFYENMADNFKINVRNYPPGLYLAALWKDGSVVVQGKFFVRPW
ncbi:MAG TPA: choice-of-anchor Q domain-containing protein [Bacteroidales bacterium]|nr:choice-of-anchor Q domain-containing protein [Bacteroidales bacterium]